MEVPISNPLSPSGRTVALIGIILVLIIAGVYAIHDFHLSLKSGSSLLPSNTLIVLGANALPAHDAHRIDLKNRNLVLLTVPGQGTASVLSEANTSKHAYYLLNGPNANQTTLYRLDPAHPAAGLTQLTTSKSMKVDLSVDVHEEFAAFTAYGSSSSPEIVVLNMQSGKEKSYGAGMHPVILQQESVAIAERDGGLVSIDLKTGDAHELIKKMPAGLQFAVNTISGQLAFYDAGANRLHQYQIADNGISLKELASSVPGEHPQALFYVGKDLYMARMLPDTLVLSSIDATRDVRIVAPGFSLNGFNLTDL